MLEKMINIVKDAAKIMLKAHDIEENSVKKGDRNFVTVYDTKIQEFIKTKISEQFPEAKFIGEEEDCQSEDPYTDFCFICDPIDGTANFMRSCNHSAVSLAATKNGEIIAGVVCNPFVDELFYAEKGKGAFLNGRKIHTSNKNLKNAIVAFGTSPYYPELSKNTIETLRKLMPDCEDIRRAGTASLDLCYTASGRYDMFFEYSLYPWDHAAGNIIIKEAGGLITDRNGKDIPLDRRSEVFAGNINAYKDFFEKDYIV